MSSGQRQETLYLIDAHALIFQVFHAIGEMSSPSGVPTNALFGFTRDLLFLRNEKRPDYLVCAFDRGEPTVRTDLYKEYKATRGPMPDDLCLQLEPIQQMLQAMRVPVLAVERYEADDVIATVATAAARKGIDVYICSSDKDCRQLLSDRIKVFNLRKLEVFDRDSLLKDWGVTPEQVVDLQTLVGDSVDNVPGVPGIGLKTAAKLLQEYGTLDNLLAHVDEVPGTKRRENLKASADLIALSRKLVTLVTDVPIPMDWDNWRLRDWDAPRLLELFREWGFHRFADQVKALSGARRQPVAVGAAASSGGAVQGELFDAGPEANGDNTALEKAIKNGQPDGGQLHYVAGHWHGNYALVDTPEKFQDFCEQLRQQPRFAVDLETTGLEPRRADLVGLAFSWRPGEAWYLPVRGPQGEAVLKTKSVLARLRPLLEDAKVAKINQNIKYDLIVLRQQGIEVQGVAGDSMVADYLLHAGERNHNMQSLARTHLQHEVIPITDLIGKKGKNQLRMDQVATARVAVYSGEDADVAWRLCGLLEAQLQEQGLKQLYDELEVPLIQVLAELEFNGIRLDVPRLQRLGEEMAGQLQAIEKDIYKIAGHEFNIASLKQLRVVLFDELKLKPLRKTGITGAASTDQETLEQLAAGHELPRKILEHRKLAKLKGTYIDALPGLVNPETGRIHASFNQTVAATGRLSSSDPNLQNIPVRSEQGGQVRQAFVPEEGWTLLTADYSQIELRLLAHFCDDAALRQAFAEDRDIHSLVAGQIYVVAEKDVTSEMRRRAKTVNFGVLYGMSQYGLATRLQIPREEAARFIDAYFARYPKVLEYQDRLLKQCRQQGYVSTILGRRRAFDRSVLREDSTYQQRNQAEREAINMEIQGSAADLIKVAMLKVYQRLKAEGRRARMLLQIHDELVFEVPPEELSPVARLVSEEMTGALASRLQVPLKVDLAAGPNWLDMTDLSL